MTKELERDVPIWYTMDPVSVSHYGPWVRLSEHREALAALRAENERLQAKVLTERSLRDDVIDFYQEVETLANAEIATLKAKLAEAMVWIANRADHGGRRIETAMQACEDIEAYVDKIIGGKDE